MENVCWLKDRASNKGKQSPSGLQMFHSSFFNVQLVKIKTKKFVTNYTFVIL